MEYRELNDPGQDRVAGQGFAQNPGIVQADLQAQHNGAGIQ